MTRIGYLDCFSGVSGDMLLGAMLDAGLPVEELRGEISKLRLEGWELRSQRVKRAGLAATQAMVEVSVTQPPRTLDDVLRLIEASSLPPEDREKGSAVLPRLGGGEGAV